MAVRPQGRWLDPLRHVSRATSSPGDRPRRLRLRVEGSSPTPTAPRRSSLGGARRATGRAPTSRVARATSERPASCAGPAAPGRERSATRSCTSRTGSPRSCTPPARMSRRPRHRRGRPARLAHRENGVIAARGLCLLDGQGDVRRQVAQLQAGAGRTEVLNRSSGEAVLAVDHQPHRRSARA